MRAFKTAIARVTIEAMSPLTVGTGGGTDLVDSICVQDANGLPTIPGSTLAGLLRHALPGGPDGLTAKKWFGYQKRNLGDRSKVQLSWAQVHGRNDRPVAFLDFAPSDDTDDRAFLTFLADGVLRDHVSLNGRGVADGRKKFDESLVPCGARFTFELRVDGGRDDDPGSVLETLLGILASPAFRLGGRTRQGFGVIRIVAAPRRVFDLRVATDRDEWSKLKRALHVPVPAGVLTTTTLPLSRVQEGFVSATLALKAEDFWLFGGGTASRATHRRTRGGEKEKSADIVPKTERQIQWSQGSGRVVHREEAPNLVAATGIKGALRHRVTYHARRLTGAWQGGDLALDDAAVRAVEWLFGKEHSTKESDRGAPGRVLLDDIRVPSRGEGAPRDGWLDHVSLDRFTGGPMDGMLFTEAPLHGGGFALRVVVDTRDEPPAFAREALRSAINDLAQGLLPLGAASNRGHGYFRGSVADDAEGALTKWLEGERHA